MLTAVEGSAAESSAELENKGGQTHGAIPAGVGLNLKDPGVDRLCEHCV